MWHGHSELCCCVGVLLLFGCDVLAMLLILQQTVKMYFRVPHRALRLHTAGPKTKCKQ